MQVQHRAVEAPYSSRSAGILNDCELGPLFRTIAQGGCNVGVDLAREGTPPAHALGEAVQRDESGASWAQRGLDRDALMTASGHQTVLDPLSTESHVIISGTEEIELEQTREADEAPVASRLSPVVAPSEDTSIES